MTTKELTTRTAKELDGLKEDAKNWGLEFNKEFTKGSLRDNGYLSECSKNIASSKSAISSIISFKNELKEIINNPNLNTFQKMVKTRNLIQEIEDVENAIQRT